MESSKEFKPIPKPEQRVEQDIQLCKQVNLEIGFEHSISPLRNGMAFLGRYKIIIYDDERNEVIIKKKIAPQNYSQRVFLEESVIFQLNDEKIILKEGDQEKTVAFSLSSPNEEQELHSQIRRLSIHSSLTPLNNTEFIYFDPSVIYIYHISNLESPTCINFYSDTGNKASAVTPINKNMLAIISQGIAWLYRKEGQEFRFFNSIDLISPDIKEMASWTYSDISISGSLNNYLLATETVVKKEQFLASEAFSIGKKLLTRVSTWELDKEDKLVKTSQWQMKDPSITQVQHFAYGPGDIRILFCKENQLIICHPDITKPITTMEIDQPIARYHILHSKKILLLHKTQQGYEIKIMQYDPLSIKEKIKTQITDAGLNLHGGVAGIIANYVHDDIQVSEEPGSKEKPVEKKPGL